MSTEHELEAALRRRADSSESRPLDVAQVGARAESRVRRRRTAMVGAVGALVVPGLIGVALVQPWTDDRPPTATDSGPISAPEQKVAEEPSAEPTKPTADKQRQLLESVPLGEPAKIGYLDGETFRYPDGTGEVVPVADRIHIYRIRTWNRGFVYGDDRFFEGTNGSWVVSDGRLEALDNANGPAAVSEDGSRIGWVTFAIPEANQRFEPVIHERDAEGRERTQQFNDDAANPILNAYGFEGDRLIFGRAFAPSQTFATDLESIPVELSEEHAETGRDSPSGRFTASLSNDGLIEVRTAAGAEVARLRPRQGRIYEWEWESDDSIIFRGTKGSWEALFRITLKKEITRVTPVVESPRASMHYIIESPR